MPKSDWCAVEGCSNIRRNTSNISYFRFPKDPKLHKEWIAKCCRVDKFNSKTTCCTICSIHFKEEDFVKRSAPEVIGTKCRRYLTEGCIPSQNLPKENQPSTSCGSKRPQMLLNNKEKELSLDFCSEQKSARSSSFKSSLKYDTSSSEVSNSSHQNTSSSINFHKMPLLKEQSENEVLSGSHLQISEPKFDLMNDSCENRKDSKRLPNWSPPSQLEVTAPCTLFSARSEELGTLSNDKEREKPYFGTTATTPPKCTETIDSSDAKFSGTSVSYNGIQAPSELYFPEKIALGDSQEMILTIRNSANVAHYHISCISAYLNDSPLPEGMCGLNFNNTVPCNVGNATDIKLIIAPKYEGKFEVNLQIDACMNPVGQSLNAIPSVAMKTKIQYTVVRPSISILWKGKNSLNLGTIITRSSFVEYVTITNNNEVAVPLRISLSNDSVGNQIYFGLKEIDGQRYSTSGALKFLSPTVLLYRIPATKNKNMPSSIDIPVVFESIKNPVLSSITAAVETPTSFEVLGFIKISAIVGNARLILKDTDQNPLILKASKGATCSHSVTVMNDGSLPVVYDLHIDSNEDVLFVSPNSLNLQPKQCATISITFTPQTYCTVKGNLLAAAEPHGQVFTLTEIVCHVKESYSSRPHGDIHQMRNIRPTKDSMDSINEFSSQIECDKKYLAWGGSDIGNITSKSFTIRNPKEEPIEVKVFIKEKNSEFMLLDEFNKTTNSFNVIVNARDAKDLTVVFLPKNISCYSGHLYVKPVIQNESKIFVIPLSGYGGISNLKIVGLSTGEKTDYCLDIDAIDDTDSAYKTITLHNCGLRAAFVKLFATGDNLVENLVSKQIFVNPSEFVLLENEKKDVLISVNGKQRKQISKTETINVLYGDEILRQRLKKISKSGSSNFTTYFPGEERVSFESTYISPKDEVLFHSSLKKIKIHVFFTGQNTSFSRTSFGPLSEIQENFSNMTLDSTTSLNSTVSSQFRRFTMENQSPVAKNANSHNLSRPLPVSCNDVNNPFNTDDIFQSMVDEFNNIKLDSWTVNTEELNIDADNKDKWILLKSYADYDLRFKVEYSVDIITVSPVSGTLSAKGEIGLRLTLISTNHNKLLDDYHGNIKISCDGVEKNVSLIVLKDKKTRNMSPSPPILNDSLRSGFLGDFDFLERTVVDLTIDNIFKFPKELDLGTTKLGCLSETIFVVGNPTKETVMWSICPRSLMFSEPSEDSVDCTRSAIEFKNTNGLIKPMATENIVIKFFPQSIACFQQFFKLTLNAKHAASQTFNMKVQGRVKKGL